jgi:phosphate transport system substrate-binding protein
MTRKHLAYSFFAVTLLIDAAHASPTINVGGADIAAPVYISEFEMYTASKPHQNFSYAGIAGDSAQVAFLSNDIALYKNPRAGTVPRGTPRYGKVGGATVAIGASDLPLSASLLTNPATGSYALSTTSNGTTYSASSSNDGPVIQLPAFGVPIVIAYNEPPMARYFILDDSELCGVLSGKITNYLVLGAASVSSPIKVFYRGDSSATTYLVTQHLNAVCTSANSNFPALPVPITDDFASLFNSNYPLPSNFTPETGDASLAEHMVATRDSFGYLPPAYTGITKVMPQYASLMPITLHNSLDGLDYLPYWYYAELALKDGGPGAVNASPPDTLAAAMNPLNWVPSVPQPARGYPIVGYTTMVVSSCYVLTGGKDVTGKAIVAFLTKDLYQKIDFGQTTVAKNYGLSPVNNAGQSKLVAAIKHVFLSNESGYNLNINNPTTCASYPGR